MRVDEEIRDRLERSLRDVDPRPARPDPVIRRARSLRRRHRAVGVLVAALVIAAVVAPLAVLWPLRDRDGSDIVPAVEPGPLVVSARIEIAPGITDVATGFGSVWVTGNNGVTRVDPATGQVIAHIAVPGTGDYSHIAIGEDSVWITAPELRPDGSRGNLVRIDPVTNEIATTLHLGGPIQFVAVGGGSVWVTRPDAGSSTLYGIDPVSERYDTIRLTEGSGPIVYGEAAVWVSTMWVGASVTKIDPTTGEIVDTFDVPSVHAVGDGSLWGATGNSVLRIDPATGEVKAGFPIERAFTVAFDGSTVWVLSEPRSSDPELFMPIAGTATVTRIDPATDRVIGEPVSLEDLQPIALAADEHGAWVADYYDGILTRITVAP